MSEDTGDSVLVTLTLGEGHVQIEQDLVKQISQVWHKQRRTGVNGLNLWLHGCQSRMQAGKL